MDGFDIPPDVLAAMMGEDPGAADIAAALRQRASMGELGMGGSAAIRASAAPMLEGARLGQDRIFKDSMAAQAARQRAGILTQSRAEAAKKLAEDRQREDAQRAEARNQQALNRENALEAARIASGLRAAEKRQERGEIRDEKTAQAISRFGNDWEPMPNSPLIDNEPARQKFIDATAGATEARGIASDLKAMVAAGLGPMSSAADKTRAESLVTRLQLIGKTVDALGVLSETDIKKFIEPQLVNPASFTVALKQGFGQFDPAAQLDQYLANINGKISASAKAYALVPRRGGAFASGSSTGKPAASMPTPKTPEEARALPKGTRFVDPDGIERVR